MWVTSKCPYEHLWYVPPLLYTVPRNSVYLKRVPTSLLRGLLTSWWIFLVSLLVGPSCALLLPPLVGLGGTGQLEDKGLAWNIPSGISQYQRRDVACMTAEAMTEQQDSRQGKATCLPWGFEVSSISPPALFFSPARETVQTRHGSTLVTDRRLPEKKKKAEAGLRSKGRCIEAVVVAETICTMETEVGHPGDC